jgi:UDP-N-acetylglucosamine:LPS N-acetylglucosamine transferase
MRRRVLIPYLSAGLGHMIQAQAISHYLRRMRPEWDVRLMDAARELDDELMRKTFVDMWKVALKMPRFLSTAVFALERLLPRAARALNRRSFRTAVPKAAAFLAATKPDLIMSTHWACSHLFSLAQQERRIPLFYFYGELRATYSVINCGADLYFTVSSHVRNMLPRLGIDPARIVQVPVVVDPHRTDSTVVPRDVLRQRLGIPNGNLTVVLSLGGEGIGRTLPFIEAFVRDVKGATLIVLTGHNTELLSKIENRIRSTTVIPMGFREDIGGITGAADILAGKCGGGYAMLAISTGLPLIVTHLGAPNERENMRYIVENGLGWYCPRPRQFTQRVSALARNGTGARQEAAAAPGSAGAPLRHRRNGAEEIAAAIVGALA